MVRVSYLVNPFNGAVVTIVLKWCCLCRPLRIRWRSLLLRCSGQTGVGVPPMSELAEASRWESSSSSQGESHLPSSAAPPSPWRCSCCQPMEEWCAGPIYIIQRSRNPHRVSLQSMPGQSPNPPLSPWWMETKHGRLGTWVWTRSDI